MYYDGSNLDKFVKAQSNDYATAYREISSGRKRSHWIWYIFPQIQGLGMSHMANYYGIRDLAHPLISAGL